MKKLFATFVLSICLVGCNPSEFQTFIDNLPQLNTGGSGNLTYTIGTNGISNDSVVDAPATIPVTIVGGVAPYVVSINTSVKSELQRSHGSKLFNIVLGNNSTGVNSKDIVTIKDATGNSVDLAINVSTKFQLAQAQTSVEPNTPTIMAQIWGGTAPYSVGINTSCETGSLVGVQIYEPQGYGEINFDAGDVGSESVVVTDATGQSLSLNVTIENTFHLCPLVSGEVTFPENKCGPYPIQIRDQNSN
jgi:hypothetical protein